MESRVFDDNDRNYRGEMMMATATHDILSEPDAGAGNTRPALDTLTLLEASMPEQTLFDSIPSVKEEWRPVVGYEGHYLVSSLGRVKSDPARKRLPNRLMSPQFNRKGYLHVCLNRNGRQKTWVIHLLVMKAFVGPRPPGLQINHKNGTKHDNWVGNLEYCTCSRNRRHAYDVGLHSHPVGELHPGAKLNEPIVRILLRCRELGLSDRFLSNIFGVTSGAVYQATRGKSWKHLRAA